MKRSFCRRELRLFTWFVLFCFVHGLFSQNLFADSAWINKNRKKETTGRGPADGEPALAKGEISPSPVGEAQADPQGVEGRGEQSGENLREDKNRLSHSETLSPPEKGGEVKKSGLNPKSLNHLSLPVAAGLDIYSDTVPLSALGEISNTFRREIKNTGQYLVYSRSEMRKAMMKNLDQELVAAKQIGEYVDQAKKLYDDFKFDSAAVIMKEAMGIIGAFDSTPAVTKKISEAYITQGLIQQAQEKDPEALVSFLNAAALDPTRQLEPALYPPNVIEKFYKAKNEFSKIKEGVLRIETDPPVAKIMVADKERGNTPATLKNLPLGIQKVTILKEGFDPYEKNIMIVKSSSDSYLNKVSIHLNRQGESASLDPLLGELVSIKDYELQISKMADIGKLLFADQIFAARLEKGEEKVYNLYVVAVDTHTGKEIARGYSRVAPNLADVDFQIAHALRDMLAHKTPDRWTERIAIEGKGGHYLASYEKRKPFYKKWPFLTLMSVLVAGGAAGAAVVLTRPSPGSVSFGKPPQP